MPSKFIEPETIIAEALDKAGIIYTREKHDRVQRIDFLLPEYDVAVEVKQFHTERSIRQLRENPNIILIQGVHAAEAFAHLINRGLGDAK